MEQLNFLCSLEMSLMIRFLIVDNTGHSNMK